MSKSTIFALVIFVSILVVYNVFRARYEADYPMAYIYASSISNIDSMNCLSLKADLKMLNSNSSNTDLFKNWNNVNVESMPSEMDLRFTAWKCVKAILDQIDSLSVSDFDELWFWDDLSDFSAALKKLNDTEKKMMVFGMFFAGQESDEGIKKILGWSTHNSIIFSKTKDAGNLWISLDNTSYRSCRDFLGQFYVNQDIAKDTSSSLVIDWCVDNIHRYMIMGSTNFSQLF